MPRPFSLFQAARNKFRTKRYLWEQIRHHFAAFLFGSMTELLTAVAVGIERQQPVLLADSS